MDRERLESSRRKRGYFSGKQFCVKENVVVISLARISVFKQRYPIRSAIDARGKMLVKVQFSEIEETVRPKERNPEAVNFI